jgi:hypothetical protein
MHALGARMTSKIVHDRPHPQAQNKGCRFQALGIVIARLDAAELELGVTSICTYKSQRFSRYHHGAGCHRCKCTLRRH